MITIDLCLEKGCEQFVIPKLLISVLKYVCVGWWYLVDLQYMHLWLMKDLTLWN